MAARADERLGDTMRRVKKEGLAADIPRRPNFAVRAGRKLFHSLLPSDVERTVVRGGISYFLNYREATDVKIIKHGRWEARQVEYFFARAEAFGCGVFLDIGAYFGYYSLLAAKHGRFSRIHAIEPSPRNYRRLARCIRDNGFDAKITSHFLGVSDSSKEMFLREDGIATALSDAGEVRVEARTLDSLFDFCGETIAVKMDIEGQEIPALRGAEKLFSRNRVFLQIEIPGDCTERIDYLRDNGWRLLRFFDCDFYFYRL